MMTLFPKVVYLSQMIAYFIDYKLHLAQLNGKLHTIKKNGVKVAFSLCTLSIVPVFMQIYMSQVQFSAC